MKIRVTNQQIVFIANVFQQTTDDREKKNMKYNNLDNDKPIYDI